MSYLVTMPEMNSPMAIQTLKELANSVIRLGSLYDFNTERHQRMFVDSFMTQYPKGKGTGRNENLRKVYAACHTLKRASSRIKRTRYRNMPDMTPTDTELVLAMPSTGTIVRIINGANARILKLAEQNIITGKIQNGGEMWLTDYGLYIREEIVKQRVNTARRARADALVETEKLVRELAALPNDLMSVAVFTSFRERAQVITARL